MIRKFVYGTPIKTGAVVVEVPASDVSILKQLEVKDGCFHYPMGEEDIIYGLGEAVRGINKRGWSYTSNCSDDSQHREDTHSLYGAHNFILFDGKSRFGLFLDCPGEVTYDLGYTNSDIATIAIKDWNFDLYIIEGNSCSDIVTQFRTLIGMSYIPPRWAFGYGQSRWSYKTEDEVREVVKRHREAGVPLDSVYLDIDYMERYKDFTIDEERFPRFGDFVAEMKSQGIHLIPIIDAGVKIEDGYSVYEEGMKKGYFCKKEDGTELVAAVWPGKVHFPDFLNEEARTWFGNQYQVILDQGIEGFWNDMNEPTIFYTKDHMDEVFDELEKYKGKNLESEEFFDFQKLVSTINNNPEDYKRFYHTMDGKKIRHDFVHNLYGYNMTKAAAEAFERLQPNKRILLFSRASYIGMHRYGGIWTGDNLSWWSHLLLIIKMMPSLNMCGFLYCGCDIGGFGADVTEDLMLRWLAFGIFTPLMRNHSTKDSRRQEFYQFERTKAFRDLIGLRYALIPYLYSEFMKAAQKNQMMFLPLAFVYDEDERAKRIEDQLLVGESIMIAPVYEQNAKGRYVYLPEDMKMIRFHSAECYEEELMGAGDHYIELGLTEVVIFLRKQHLLPLAKAAQTVDEIKMEELMLLSYGTGCITYQLYEDDGITKEFGSYQTLSSANDYEK